MVRFLSDVAQLGNLRLSDDDEVAVLDDLRRVAAGLLDVPTTGLAITGGASEALGQVASLVGKIDGSVLLCLVRLSECDLSVARPRRGSARRSGRSTMVPRRT